MRVRHCPDVERVCDVAYGAFCPSIFWEVSSTVSPTVLTSLYCKSSAARSSGLTSFPGIVLKTVRVKDRHDVIKRFSNDVVFRFEFQNKPCFRLFNQISGIGGGREFCLYTDGFSAAVQLRVHPVHCYRGGRRSLLFPVPSRGACFVRCSPNSFVIVVSRRFGMIL